MADPIDPQELTERCWAIAERLGNPVPEHTKVWETVRNELGKHLGPVEALAIAGHVREWMLTRNPHHMDAASLLCQQYGAPITPAIQAQLTRAAKLRFSGGASGTPEKIVKDGKLDAALITMANLVYEGLTIAQAASKVAAAIKAYKASSLERYYAERIRPKMERELFRSWREHAPDHGETWQPIIAAMPDTPEHERGERR